MSEKNQREIIAKFESLREEVQNLQQTIAERRANVQVGPGNDKS